jgi:hypothetical protein
MEGRMLYFLRGALGAMMAVLMAGWAASAEFDAPTGDVLLTVSGAIRATNVDDTLQLDQALLESLPQTEFSTSTTWTTGITTFKGVLMKDLVAAIGATGGTITLRAVNDYAISMPLTDLDEDAPLLAFLVDGKTMSLRDKGPIWMVYPYDKEDKFRTEEVFSRSIWQLTEITFAD